jgi:phage terminase small subunit
MADQDLVQTNTNKNGTGYSMGVPKKLTEKQMKFAHEIVTNEGRKTATECAVDAGFEPDFARQYASKLQNPKLYPLVVKYIGELREEWQKKYEVTYDRHISELGKIRQQALNKGAWSAAVNAEVARGKAAGLYIEQKIIRTGKLEDLTTEELENRMKQIIDDYSPILEDVPFEELKEKVKADTVLQTTEHQEEPPSESSLSSSHKKSGKQNAQKNE